MVSRSKSETARSMAKIIVNSDPSYQPGDWEETRSHPGTTGDDIFTISPDSHGYPFVNDDPDLHGGNDIYQLSLDVFPDELKPHPYQEGGGTPMIEGFSLERDKIILPDGVDLKDILIINYTIPDPDQIDEHELALSFSSAEIRYDPHKAYEMVYPPFGELGSRFGVGWKIGRTLVYGGRWSALEWKGIDPMKNKENDPEGYRQWIKEGETNALALGLDTVRYGADDIGSVEFKGNIKDFFSRIFDQNGVSLHEYAFNKRTGPSHETNQKDPASKAHSSLVKPKKFNKKFIDKITNFQPTNNTLAIDSDGFGIDSAPTFAVGKNKKVVKRQLAKLDIDFLYDQKKGWLYFNENGTEKGFGDGGIIAILKGAPELTSDNLEFI